MSSIGVWMFPSEHNGYMQAPWYTTKHCSILSVLRTGAELRFSSAEIVCTGMGSTFLIPFAEGKLHPVTLVKGSFGNKSSPLDGKFLFYTS